MPSGSGDVAKQLYAALRKSVLKQRPLEGFVKCPECGANVVPTKTARIRVHADPLKAKRCPASGREWRDFGKRPPRPKRERSGA